MRCGGRFPALDDEFSKKIGAADSLDELKTKIRDSISQVCYLV